MADILVIEDDIALQEAYSFMLEMGGHHITSAYNGREGIAKTKRHAYDIVLLDIHMPVMNGLEFLEAFMKTRPEHTKIIVFSNMIEPEIENQALKLGADICILKSSATPSSMLASIEAVSLR